MGFTSKQVVTMVVAVSMAAVFTPVGVMAATGQLVNIADGSNGRLAKVGSSNTLYVESRAGVVDHSFNAVHENITNVIGHVIYEVSGKRIAVSEATFTLHGDNSASTNHVRLYSRVRTSGTATCANGSGWSTPKTLRTVVVRAGSTVQLLFNGPPLITQTPGAGQKVCLGFQQTKWTGSTSLDMALTGFTFV